ncbi:hypothetical protein DIPPA_55383 [Diplonema papillatum]|nr:hypothetical protein DIPPA_55383 [Diplonema papillatum]
MLFCGQNSSSLSHLVPSQKIQQGASSAHSTVWYATHKGTVTVHGPVHLVLPPLVMVKTSRALTSARNRTPTTTFLRALDTAIYAVCAPRGDENGLRAPTGS